MMGIIGGTASFRSVMMPISLILMLLGSLSFLYSKFVEQGAIRVGAAAVRKVLDEVVIPRYDRNQHLLKWTVRAYCLDRAACWHGGDESIECGLLHGGRIVGALFGGVNQCR